MNGMQEDRRKIARFFRETHRFVTELAREANPAYFPQDLAELIQRAGREFEEEFDLADASKKLREAPADNLREAGLFGSQLELKLAVVDRFKKAFKRLPWKPILKKLIDAIDSVLDSIVAAVGIGEALKELKDILRRLLDED